MPQRTTDLLLLHWVSANVACARDIRATVCCRRHRQSVCCEDDRWNENVRRVIGVFYPKFRHAPHTPLSPAGGHRKAGGSFTPFRFRASSMPHIRVCQRPYADVNVQMTDTCLPGQSQTYVNSVTTVSSGHSGCDTPTSRLASQRTNSSSPTGSVQRVPDTLCDAACGSTPATHPMIT